MRDRRYAQPMGRVQQVIPARKEITEKASSQFDLNFGIQGHVESLA